MKTEKGSQHKHRLFMALAWIIITAAVNCSADELILPGAQAVSGEVVTVPIKLKQVQDLAGMKLVIQYDDKLLTYKDAAKSPIASSFLHIVNDKKPGVLIIVMAGAIGIKGNDITMITIDFAVSESVENKQTTRLEVTELQLMSEKLKELHFKITSHPIEISPKPAPVPNNEKP